MQTNNDTHGPENKFSSTWCREFGAAAPRHNTLYMIFRQHTDRIPGTHTRTRPRCGTQKHVSLRRNCSPIGRRTEQKHARRTNGEKGLPILALGKGTSAGPSGTQYVQRGEGFNAPNCWCRFRV